MEERSRRPVRTYTAERRQEARRLLRNGATVRQVGCQLGLPVSTVAKWAHWATPETSSTTCAPMGPKRHLGRARFLELVVAGVSVSAAAAHIGVTRSTGGRWDKAYREHVGAPPLHGLRPRRPYNEKMHRTVALPSERSRYLSLRERELIHDLRRAGTSLRSIGTMLGRPASTISRELTRNSDSVGNYLQYAAERRAVLRRARPKMRRLARQPRLRLWVQGKLDVQWSPAQISARLSREFPHDPVMRIAPETIYQALYDSEHAGLASWAGMNLRTGRASRRRRRRFRQSRVARLGMISIRECPATVDDRTVPGHWEGDLVTGAFNRSAVATLVERHTRYVLLGHLPGAHSADAVATAVCEQLARVPSELRGTLTWNQGSEMAAHRSITERLGVPVFFCDPASPWQRGNNENTNGLLRQYLPKGSDLSKTSPETLERIADLLNHRPRKVLDWDTAAERMKDLIATLT